MITCSRTRRTVERAAALGQPLPQDARTTEHLRSCARCRTYAADLAHLNEALDASLAQVEALPSLTDRIMANLEIRTPSKRPVLSFAHAAWGSTAIASAALALWILWPAAAPKMAVQPLGGSGEPQQALAKVTPDVPVAPVAPSAQAGASHERTKPQPAVVRARRRSVQPTAPVALASAKTPAASAQQPPSSQQWAEAGEYYAESGDQLRAARAYGCAAKMDRTHGSGLALEAGRAAEAGGDVGSALDYYIQALEDSPSNGSQPQKGTMRTPDDDQPHVQARLS